MSSYAGLDSAIGGAYSPLGSENWYGGEFVIEAELRACNGKRPTNSKFGSGRLMQAYQMSYTPNMTVYNWQHSYFVISAANNVINSIDEGKVAPDTEVSQQDLDNLKAEGLFLRALCHFDVARVYAQAYSKGTDAPGVPVVLASDATGTEKPGRGTVGEVYDQIVEDLLEAESLIAEDYVRPGFVDPTASATLYSIQALLSRVYLYMEEWQEAADYATKVIESGKYDMWTAEEFGSEDLWGVDVPAEGSEVIFEVYVTDANSYEAGDVSCHYLTKWDGYSDAAASKILTGLYEDGDVRGTLFKTDDNNASGGELWPTKYPGKGEKSGTDTNNTVLIRLSEMYLNRAEAQVNGATVAGTTALDDVNVITSHRGAAAYASIGKASILEERRKELAYEGHYWFDLARTKSSLDYTDETITRHLTANDAWWALPIPQREIDSNSNLVQNVY